MTDADPDYFEIVSRAAVETAAERPEKDLLGILAREMLSAVDEREVFKRGVRGYISKADQQRRRFAIAALAATFCANGTKDLAKMKRLLLFWGVVNLTD